LLIESSGFKSNALDPETTTVRQVFGAMSGSAEDGDDEIVEVPRPKGKGTRSKRAKKSKVAIDPNGIYQPMSKSDEEGEVWTTLPSTAYETVADWRTVIELYPLGIFARRFILKINSKGEIRTHGKETNRDMRRRQSQGGFKGTLCKSYTSHHYRFFSDDPFY
jgi:hypothetical protein